MMVVREEEEGDRDDGGYRGCSYELTLGLCHQGESGSYDEGSRLFLCNQLVVY